MSNKILRGMKGAFKKGAKHTLNKSERGRKVNKTIEATVFIVKHKFMILIIFGAVLVFLILLSILSLNSGLSKAGLIDENGMCITKGDYTHETFLDNLTRYQNGASMNIGEKIDENIKYSLGEICSPVPVPFRVSSPFGYRTHPVTKKVSFHKGVDIPYPQGTKVVAVKDGIVLQARMQGSYGNMILIDHGGGFQSRYAHNYKLFVSPGQKVKKGDVISLVGSTGRSTGPHLHFEIILQGKNVNPLLYIK